MDTSRSTALRRGSDLSWLGPGRPLLRILLVDDQESSFLDIKRLTAEAVRFSAEIGWVATSQTGLAALASGAYDVCLVSQRLDNGEGAQLLADAAARRATTPIVLLTDRGDEAAGHAALSIGAADFLGRDELTARALERSIAQSVVTARAQAELQATEQRFQAAAESAGGLLYDWDLSTDRVSWYGDVDAELGYAPGEFPRTARAWQELIHPDDRDRIIDSMHRDLLSSARGAHEYRVRRKDGSFASWADRGRAVRDPQGQASRWIGCVSDVTARTAAERALHDSEQRLTEAQKMEAVGRLAGGVAHDFNNLLTVILGYVDALRARFAGDAEALLDLNEIDKASEHAALLTRQLLTFSRRQVLQPRVLDLNWIVIDTDRMVNRIVGEDIHLDVDLAAGLRSVHADPGQLKQVLLNLVVNAREAMPNGGTLTITTTNVELSDDDQRGVFMAASGPYVMLVVSDTGVGMTEETRAHLFEPFYTTKGGRGTGLGLSTVYGIVQQSGGDLQVSSGLGQGTTFKILLPSVDSAPEPVVAAPVRPALGHERLLVVEDEPGVGTLLATILRQQGYDVLQAANAEEALTIAGEFMGEIHLLITDIVMPGMNGRALATRMETLRPGIKTLFMSGYTDHASVGPDMLEPGVHFLQKPFAPSVFSATVRELLDEA
ncbi:MAG: response regulator [Acidobacteria bacterium]|nr:response regulator [Acidobacteriota bacterium]